MSTEKEQRPGSAAVRHTQQLIAFNKKQRKTRQTTAISDFRLSLVQLLSKSLTIYQRLCRIHHPPSTLDVFDALLIHDINILVFAPPFNFITQYDSAIRGHAPLTMHKATLGVQRILLMPGCSAPRNSSLC